MREHRRAVARAALAFLLTTALLAGGATTQAVAQAGGALERPYEVMRRGLRANNYLGPLVELKSREAEYLASERTRQSYLEYLILLNSYVGEFGAAYRYEDTLLSDIDTRTKLRARNAKEVAAAPFDAFRAREAVGAIVSAAEGRQVVMLNEEHRTPVHRALTLRVLRELYREGFRYFAAETLEEADAGLNRRGYPVQTSGSYTADPVFGELVRTALRLGYKVVPYEYQGDCRPTPEQPFACDDLRERVQAQNLFERIFKADPKAKVLVHVGRGHNSKTKYDGQGFAFMAWHFRELSRMDPLTVDQVQMSERHNPSDEDPLFRYASRRFHPREPFVFLSSAGRFWSPKEGYDVTVFTARVVYERGRPAWLRMGGLRSERAVDLKRLKVESRGGAAGAGEPLLVQAFVKGESADAIPADQFVLWPGRPAPPLLLPAGSFSVRAINARGEVTGRYDLTVTRGPRSGR